MTPELATPEAGQTEEDLRQQIAMLNAKLNDVQRLTALGELVGTTTHEFNNILMTIINYAKMGMRQPDEQARTRSLKKILESGERAAKITNSILGIARNRNDRFEPIDLEAIIKDAMLLMERELRKYRIRVYLQLSAIPRTLANGNQIQQILLNLLTNARQAIVDGGEVVVRLEHDPESGMNQLTVRDDGKGIPADQLRKIFNPFYTTKTGPDGSGKGGTGLGLSACRNIIEKHGGRVRVESTVGKGTAFIIKLPVAEQTDSGVSG